MKRRPFRPLRYTLVRARANALAYKMIKRRPIGVPGTKWGSRDRREVYRNGYQPKLRQIAFEALRAMRAAWLRRDFNSQEDAVVFVNRIIASRDGKGGGSLSSSEQ